MLGLAKKMLVANPLGGVADAVFAIAPGALGTQTAWLGIICYALQIYFDFSGYSDMAIGLGRLFGFSLPENFRAPYAATLRRRCISWGVSGEILDSHTSITRLSGPSTSEMNCDVEIPKTSPRGSPR